MALNWDAIEADYRAGVLSNCAIAKKYGCSESAIRKRAKRDEWVKDLSDKYRREVRAQLVREQGRVAPARDTARSDAEIVREAAASGVEVVRQHRQHLSRLLNTGNRLLDHVDAVLEAEPGACTPNDLKAAAKSYADAARAFAQAIPLERQAHALDERNDDDDGSPDCIQIHVGRE